MKRKMQMNVKILEERIYIKEIQSHTTKGNERSQFQVTRVLLTTR